MQIPDSNEKLGSFIYDDLCKPSLLSTLFLALACLVLCSKLMHSLFLSTTKGGEKKAKRVYTIGCFDLFHYGHIKLLERMREYGDKLIVGVHDDASITKLKNRAPIDPVEVRIQNVKKYADMVFVIPATDPTPFIRTMIDVTKEETAIYVRGDDMPNFPARSEVEKYMPVKLIPYTQGISTTLLRRNMAVEE